jgi:hypothetical protein
MPGIVSFEEWIEHAFSREVHIQQAARYFDLFTAGGTGANRGGGSDEQTNIWHEATSAARGFRRLTSNRLRAITPSAASSRDPLPSVSAAGLSIAGVRNLRPLVGMRSEPLSQRQSFCGHVH